jgi:hypothetical protein
MIHRPTIHLWIPKATPEAMAVGAARDLAEEGANLAYDAMIAPPCPACGRPVKDAEYERHRRVDHSDNEVVQPYGKPDAREVMLLAYSADDMDRKLAIWRSRHPGIRLEPSGDGTREDGRIIFRRWRIFDARGRAAE